MLIVETDRLTGPALETRLTNRATVETVGIIWIWGGFFMIGEERLRLARVRLERPTLGI